MTSLEEILLAYKAGQLSEDELRDRVRKLRELEPFPLSEGQRGLYVEHSLAPDSASYNIPLALRVREPLDGERIRRACAAVLAQQPALAMTFAEIGGAPHQRPTSPESVAVAWEDWSASSDEAAVERMKEISRRPFSFGDAPLLRVHVLARAPEDHFVLFVVHHIVFDGASWPVFLSAFWRAYDDGGAASPPPRASYRDFVRWEQQMLSSEEGEAHLRYWREQLAGPLGVITLPEDARGAARVPAVTRAVGHVIGEDPSARIRAVARALDVTPAIYFLAAYDLLLRRYANETDVVVGVPTMGRPHARFDETIGFFVTMIPVRGRVDDGEAFSAFARALRATLAEGMRHAAYPFPRLVRELNAPRDRAPIFQVGYSFVNASLFDRRDLRDRFERGGKISIVDEVSDAAAFGEYPLALEVTERKGAYHLSFKYDAARLGDPAVARMMRHYAAIVAAACEAPETPLGRIPMLSREERAALVVDPNRTAAPYRRELRVHDLFAAQVARTPEACAIVHEGTRLTYAEIDRRSSALASYLTAKGVEPGRSVAVCLERGPDFVVSLLAVLKAGAAYVPLDPSYPPARLDHMIRNAAAPIVLTQTSVIERLPAGLAALVAIDRDEARIAACAPHAARPGTPRDVAYVIYTSGSTGRPKGIAMPHRALVNLIDWQARQSPPGPSRTLQFAALGFDVAFQEVFSTLCGGGTLVIAPDEARRDPRLLCELLAEQQVARAFFPVGALQMLAEECDRSGRELPDIREIITAGEQLRISPPVARFFERHRACALHNQYGPSETHVVTSFTLEGDASRWEELPPIGRPIANAEIYLLDPQGEPVPAGVAGEIYIGGDCLARGYLRDPELTARRFVAHPFRDDPEARVYRTGDLGRRRADGEIEFLGRADDQVKIRGHRVEPVEIESALREHAAVKDAVVLAREIAGGERRLVAYLTPRGGAPAQDDLRAYLRGRLPEYMVPAAFVVLEAFPTSPNGKLDKRALPPPDFSLGAAPEYEAPRGEMEIALARIWVDLLRIERVGRHDHFFDMGGHSLLATQLAGRARDALGVELSPRAIFDHPTLAGLADYVGALKEAGNLSGESAGPTNGPRHRGTL